MHITERNSLTTTRQLIW